MTSSLTLGLFNVRVYGICLIDDAYFVLSRERYEKYELIKFPGGGLEYGEGLKEALMREWKEEANLDIEVKEHFYTTDFFQRSMIEDRQVISIYYWVKLKDNLTFPIKTDTGSLFLCPKDQLMDMIHLPIDLAVGKLLIEKY